MDWKELRLCNDSGLVDVESHGWRHGLIYTSPDLEAFATPELLRNYDIFDWPMRTQGNANELVFPQLGTPVCNVTPLLSAKFRIIKDPSISVLCQGVATPKLFEHDCMKNY